ncbi:hypothetical protein QE152_g15456 [Popillia japonica]|uniref:Uncharacterized protein n=1 Tax=Popillia japonica TaxID=7064 RepID=A0AAW1L8X8_POPJA
MVQTGLAQTEVGRINLDKKHGIRYPKVSGDKLSSDSDAGKPFLQELANKIKFMQKKERHWKLNTKLLRTHGYQFYSSNCFASRLSNKSDWNSEDLVPLSLLNQRRELVNDGHSETTEINNVLKNVTTENIKLTEPEICEWIDSDEELRFIVMRATLKRM